MQKLVMLGVTANNADILEAVHRLNAAEPAFELVGYVDPSGEPKAGVEIPFLGGDEAVAALAEDVQVIGFRYGPGNYRSWPGTVQAFGLPQERWATVIHPMACVSPGSRVGHGSVVMSGTFVGPDVRIGNHVTLLQNATVSHDDTIGDYSCLSVGATLAGSVSIGRSCFIGANATVIARSVGDGSMIGAGTLVRRNVPPDEVWVGNPGRKLRDAG